ncbi:hypothetical protein WOLCODRAFT_139886 [Wolfiporia cocos MD-104 SS10]|uniref:PH domain-containing protein n=1 Tax=Wolfiporia cocos (strain MD-104) TaxID=742152 RepID=A0A2H3JCJ1_WOLCO|nr:hypothetical protein WOLCODRAFT_139886 [Wolfiporia cocos MD-104 SS10]
MSASRAATVVQESPRTQSVTDVRAPQFLVRTSHFLRKVPGFRGGRRKSSDNKQLVGAGACTTNSYARSARSMDLGSKVAMLNTAHPAIHIERNEHSQSPTGSSSENGADSRDEIRTAISMPQLSLAANSAQSEHSSLAAALVRSTPEIESHPQNGVTQVSREHVLDGIPPSLRPGHSVEAAVPSSSSSGPAESADTAPGDAPNSITPTLSPVVQTLPTRTVSLGAASVATSSSQATVPGQVSPGLSDRRNLPPRLATLPAPMMASFAAKGSARLTPSIVPRQPPIPILNLPTLPPITPSQPSRPRQQAPLRSIPALPMRGPSEHQQEADHDNALLEDDDEEYEEGEDHDGSPGTREADGAASDEEYAEDTSEMTSSSPDTPQSRGDRLSALPNSSRAQASLAKTEDTEASHGSLYFTPQPDFLPTPRVRSGTSSSTAIDYFTAKKFESRDTARSHSPSQTPRPSDYFGASSSLYTPQLANGPKVIPMPPGSPRPGLYHLGSRSMVDLFSTSTKRGKEKLAAASPTPDITAERRRSKVLPGPPTIEEHETDASKPRVEPAEDVLPATPNLRRQRSLPTYRLTSEPPPYPSFHPRFMPIIQPRDEEGQERLPPYSNAIHLVAVMPRKLEFIAPGVQARDRKWRRVLCVLEGTAFRVYKCPPGASGVSAIEEWWEKKVGVGDITTTNGTAVTQSGIRVSAVRGRGTSERERPPKADEGDEQPPSSRPETTEANTPPLQPSPTRSKLQNLLHPSRAHSHHRGSSSTNGRSSTSSSQQNGSGSGHQTRGSTDARPDEHSLISVVPRASTELQSSRRSSFVSNANPSSSPPGNDNASFFSRSRLLPGSGLSDHSQPGSAKSIPPPSEKDLMHTYTLQHAESGLASDYTKRKNVIRVRMEGEQFLLQAQDVASVIDWIEGIQAATNIALDLDERPMPKGPMFPRRRRRRPRPAAGAPDNNRNAAAANNTSSSTVTA